MNCRYVHFAIYVFFICGVSFIFPKKVLVTGGAGFIGSHVVQKLLSRGDFVVIVDNLNDAYPLFIKHNNLSLIHNSINSNNLRFYENDICDKKAMYSIFEKEQPDVICHLAARAGVRTSVDDPLEYIRTNVAGTTTIFEMARLFGVKHIVSASSSSVYGVREDGLFSEENEVNAQSSPYGATKRMTELLAYVYHYLHGISITNLRFFTVYGPRGRMDMAPFIFMDALHNNKPISVYGNGSAIRDFTYVDDIVDGIIKSIDTPLGYQILNLGRGEPIILDDFIHMLEKITGKSAMISYKDGFAGDVPKTHADITKAHQLLGYTPCVSTFDGLSTMYQWYKNEYVHLKKTDKKRSSFDCNNLACNDSVVCYMD